METLQEQENEKVSTITATEAANNTSEIINRVAFRRETVIVSRHRKPTVAMIPYEDYVSLDNILLSNHDRNLFLEALSSPPAPNASLKKAMKEIHKKS